MKFSLVKKFLLLVIICGLCTCAGSGSSGSGGGAGEGRLRFLNLVPIQEKFNVYVDDNPDPIVIEYGVPTEYFDFGRDTVQIRVQVISSPLDLVDKPYSLKSTSDKTLVLFGDSNPNPAPGKYNIAPSLLNDSHEQKDDNRFDLRVINGDPASKAFDVFVTVPGVPLDNLLPVIEGIGFKSKDRYESGSESYGVITFVDTKSREVLYASDPIDLGAHPVLTLYALDLTAPNVLISYDSDL